MKHAWRDLAERRLDDLEARASAAREAAEAPIRLVGAFMPLPQERRKALGLVVKRLEGPEPAGASRAPRLALELVAQEVPLCDFHKRARAAGDEAELEVRSSQAHWIKRRILLPEGERATRNGRKVHIPEHVREVGAYLPDGLPATPEALSLTSQQSAKRCTKSHIYVECGCGSQLLERGCGSSDCVECADEVAARRARRVKERLERGMWGKGAHVHRVIFTVPERARAGLVDPDKWRELGRAVAKMLRTSDILHFTFCVEATHPVGDENPEKFHPHFNFLGVQPRGFRFFLTKVQIKRLRLYWARLLDLPYSEVNPPEVNFYKPRGTAAQQKALALDLRYTLRPFAGWAAWLPSVRWFGAYPKCPANEKWFESFCPHCGVAFILRATGDNAVQLALRELHQAGLDRHGLRTTGPPVVFPPTDLEPGSLA